MDYACSSRMKVNGVCDVCTQEPEEQIADWFSPPGSTGVGVPGR